MVCANYFIEYMVKYAISSEIYFDKFFLRESALLGVSKATLANYVRIIFCYCCTEFGCFYQKSI